MAFKQLTTAQLRATRLYTFTRTIKKVDGTFPTIDDATNIAAKWFNDKRLVDIGSLVSGDLLTQAQRDNLTLKSQLSESQADAATAKTMQQSLRAELAEDAEVIDALRAQIVELMAKLEPAPPTPPNPYELNWPDRRQIARYFLGKYDSKTPQNPNGHTLWTNWAMGKGSGVPVDITVPGGVAKFNADLIAFFVTCADECVRLNYQGAIIWDLEGQLSSYFDPSAVTPTFNGMLGLNYWGHPTQWSKVCPHLASDTPAKICKVFLDRGLKIGFGLRANGIAPSELSAYGVTLTADMDYALVAKDVALCKTWGATLFYVDSNSPRDGLAIAAIAAANPDCLINPENYPQGIPATWSFANTEDAVSLEAFLRTTAIYVNDNTGTPDFAPPKGFRLFSTSGKNPRSGVDILFGTGH